MNDSSNRGAFVGHHLLEVAAAAERTDAICADKISEAGQLLVESFGTGGQLLICGNGGSAAHASHLAGEFVSSFRRGLARRALPAISLSDNVSAFSAYVNDFDGEEVFARHVEAFARRGDVLLAISTSGNSRNVLSAARAAEVADVRVIGLTGAGPNRLAEMAEVSIMVPSSDTSTVQALQLAIGHILCEFVDDAFS